MQVSRVGTQRFSCFLLDRPFKRASVGGEVLAQTVIEPILMLPHACPERASSLGEGAAAFLPTEILLRHKPPRFEPSAQTPTSRPSVGNADRAVKTTLLRMLDWERPADGRRFLPEATACPGRSCEGVKRREEGGATQPTEQSAKIMQLPEWDSMESVAEMLGGSLRPHTRRTLLV